MVQRCKGGIVPSVDIYIAVVEKQFGHLLGALPGRIVQGGRALTVGQGRVGTMTQQGACTLQTVEPGKRNKLTQLSKTFE